MLRVKKQVTFGTLTCAIFFAIVAVSIPAGAVNPAAANGEGTQEDSGDISGIKLESPSGTTPQTQGKVEIEKHFPVTENSDAAKGENSEDLKVSDPPRENSQELQIIYGHEQEKVTSETDVLTSEAEDNSRISLFFLLIPVIVVLLFVAFYIKKQKKKEEVNQ